MVPIKKLTADEIKHPEKTVKQGTTAAALEMKHDQSNVRSLSF
jgi:hypothetical protein